MESAISSVTATTATSSFFTISKALNRGGAVVSRSSLTKHCVAARLVTRRLRCICNSYCLQRSAPFRSASYSSPSSILTLRSLSAAAELPLRRRGGRASGFAALFSSGGGNGGIGGESGGGGDGGGGSDGGDSKSKLGAQGAEDVSAIAGDVIVLDVGGMTCGGCAASVKRILESQPQVASASVNLTTETAVVWPLAEAKVVPDWQQQLGEALAKHLTSCGFKSNLRGESQQPLVE